VAGGALFDGKEYLVLYDNGRRGKYHAQATTRSGSMDDPAFHLNWLEQAHIGSGVQVAVLRDDDEYYECEATVVQEQVAKTRNVCFI
jgi:hypothetical protein